MTAAEAATFEAGPLFGACRRLRRYDERAKDPALLGVPPFSNMEGGLYRGYLSPAYRAAQAACRELVAEADAKAAKKGGK